MRDTEEGKSRITHFEKIFGFKNISSNLQFTSDSQWNKTYFFNSADFKMWIVSNKTEAPKCKPVYHQFYSLQVVKCFRGFYEFKIAVYIYYIKKEDFDNAVWCCSWFWNRIEWENKMKYFLWFFKIFLNMYVTREI